MQKKETIINLRFKSELSTEKVCKITEARKNLLRNTKGLVSLFCYTNEETNIIGGIYIFENMQLAHQYLGRFLIEGIGPKYQIIPMTLKIDVVNLIEEIKGVNLGQS